MYRLKFSCLDYACVENFTYMYVLFNGLEFCKVESFLHTHVCSTKNGNKNSNKNMHK